MSKAVANNLSSDLDHYDWHAELGKLAFAHGRPTVSGRIKTEPEDFIVTEIMDVVPSGVGEHIWLDISKRRNNTDKVARELAKFSGVANRDVGYSGLKDFQACTRQWFSVWRPKGEPLDWSEFSVDGVRLEQIERHSRKIKRGTHSRNRFDIRIRDLSFHDSQEAGVALLESRLTEIGTQGAPNYFGPQRFGRNANNMPQALAMFAGRKRVKDRHLRGLLLSSARSWLFNHVLSARVAAATWDCLFASEPANLSGSNSCFNAVNSEAERARISAFDIHPTAPIWGEGREDFNLTCPDLAEFERACLAPFGPLLRGLESARLAHQRRSTRVVPHDFSWRFEGNSLVLKFELSAGQYATSVLREIVGEDG